jgi:hypothetical protein
MEAICSCELGHYNQSIALCMTARNLLVFCGLSGGEVDLNTMSTQAEVHRVKSKYEAQKIIKWILQNISVNQDAHIHGSALLNAAANELSMGVPPDNAEEY